MKIFVDQFFHPVGHGTFHTAVAWSYPGEYGFTWAYDCGSKRKSTLQSAIQQLLFTASSWGREEQVDLFVLSHFDDDHINGVESFLSTWPVRWLALPYTDLAQKLAQAASLNSEPCSASTALFQLDPIQWLESRGLSGQVDTLLEVEGGGGRDLPDDPDQIFRERGPRPQPDPMSPREYVGENFVRGKRFLKHGGETDLESYATSKASLAQLPGYGPKTVTLRHSQPFHAIGSRLEFMFYNSDQPDVCKTLPSAERVARRSGVSLAMVESDIQDVIKRYRIGFPRAEPRPRWRQELRKIYDKHFGQSSQARNNISLCLMTRLKCEPCFLGCPECSKIGISEQSASSLWLGDLKVDAATLRSMRKHYGLKRWSSLSAVQVPHHGSCHSWEAGNAAQFDPELFIHCVPDISNHHPHRDVESDLLAHNVLRADYRYGVSIRFRSQPGHMILRTKNDTVFDPFFF